MAGRAAELLWTYHVDAELGLGLHEQHALIHGADGAQGPGGSLHPQLEL